MPRPDRLSLMVCVSLLAATTARAQLLPPVLPPPPPPPIVVPLAIPPGVLDPILQGRLNLPGRSRVIVGAHNAAGAGSLAALVAQAGGVLRRPLGLVDGVAAEIPNASIALLASNPLVRHLALDRLVARAGDCTTETIGAKAAREQFGYTGDGIGVAVIDSGITGWHDDLMRDGVPGSQRVDQFVDLVNGHAAPYDDYGHGTHVAGIIAGNGYDSGGARAGVAPGSHLVVLKVLDASGRGRISDVIAAFDHVVQHWQEFNIRVVNLSVAAMVSESYTTDFLTLAARRVVERGIVVVAAAGNAGRGADGRTQYGGITAPGNAPWVLTVGASSHMGTIDRSDDTIAAFSSRGPTAVDRAAKPDLVAPGVGIVSLSDPASAMYTTKAPYLIDGTADTTYRPYLSLSGTSQAAPVVAGTVALMLHANPSLTPNVVKAILQYTAEARDGYDAMSRGAGFLNAGGAIELARALGAPDDHTAPSMTGWSRALHWGNQRIANGTLVAGTNAWASEVPWGARVTPIGQTIRWGLTCAIGACDGIQPPIVWEDTCIDTDCRTVVWDRGRSVNVVWGMACGGNDCDESWPGPPGESPPEGYAIWGTSDSGETLVWGTNDDNETLVWGTSDDNDTLVWGTTCEDPSCNP
ncbi:MAG TPA: S8 family peptidase [Vicinamibacterales bacterium]|nr:S8 family peptidase [Vicinamibacterales bacterium]